MGERLLYQKNPVDDVASTGPPITNVQEAVLAVEIKRSTIPDFRYRVL
jgi:hypothetical protein